MDVYLAGLYPCLLPGACKCRLLRVGRRSHLGVLACEWPVAGRTAAESAQALAGAGPDFDRLRADPRNDFQWFGRREVCDAAFGEPARSVARGLVDGTVCALFRAILLRAQDTHLHSARVCDCGGHRVVPWGFRIRASLSGCAFCLHLAGMVAVGRVGIYHRDARCGLVGRTVARKHAAVGGHTS